MIRSLLLGLVRHALTTGGGVLVTHGLMTNADLNQGVGAVMVLLGLAWSAWDKRQAAAATVYVAPATLRPSPPGTTADDLNRAELDQLRR